jgi:hypothetical protein
MSQIFILLHIQCNELNVFGFFKQGIKKQRRNLLAFWNISIIIFLCFLLIKVSYMFLFVSHI